MHCPECASESDEGWFAPVRPLVRRGHPEGRHARTIRLARNPSLCPVLIPSYFPVQWHSPQMKQSLCPAVAMERVDRCYRLGEPIQTTAAMALLEALAGAAGGIIIFVR